MQRHFEKSKRLSKGVEWKQMIFASMKIKIKCEKCGARDHYTKLGTDVPDEVQCLECRAMVYRNRPNNEESNDDKGNDGKAVVSPDHS